MPPKIIKLTLSPWWIVPGCLVGGAALYHYGSRAGYVIFDFFAGYHPR